MADDDIELVRRAFEVFSTGNVDAMVDLFTDDGEWETDPAFPGGGTLSGREAIRQHVADVHEGWLDSSAATLKEARRVGDSVLATGSWQASGELSGVDVSSDWFTLWTVRNGRIARVRFFLDRAEALAAAGLSD